MECAVINKDRTEEHQDRGASEWVGTSMKSCLMAILRTSEPGMDNQTGKTSNPSLIEGGLCGSQDFRLGGLRHTTNSMSCVKPESSMIICHTSATTKPAATEGSDPWMIVVNLVHPSQVQLFTKDQPDTIPRLSNDAEHAD